MNSCGKQSLTVWKILSALNATLSSRLRWIRFLTSLTVKFGREKVEYLDPRMEPILRETYGIMVYQEQVMLVARAIGGYSLGGADLLRRAMG